MPTTLQKAAQRASKPKPVPASADGTLLPPPPAGSAEEALATALAVGFPGAFGTTYNTVEREILSLLLWEM